MTFFPISENVITSNLKTAGYKVFPWVNHFLKEPDRKKIWLKNPSITESKEEFENQKFEGDD